GDVTLVHAPRPPDAERAHRVPRRQGGRAPARARDRGAVAQLRRLRTPDREPPPLQREVRAALGAALPPLAEPSRHAAGRPRRDAGRGSPAAAARPALTRRLSRPSRT